MSTVVVTKFVTSEAYQADPHVIDEGMKLISSCKGVLANYHGILLEDRSVGFSVQVATSAEGFLAVVSNKELFDSIHEKMSIARVGDIEQRHFNAFSDPYPPLTAPLTEITYWTLKNPTPDTKQTANDILANFSKFTKGKFTFGWTGEDPNTCIVIAAWDSVEAHQEVAKNADASEGLVKFAELVHTNEGIFRHVKLTKV